MQPSVIAITVCLLPLAGVILSWLWSSMVGVIPWCNPFWDGCVSISKAARSSDALFLFRGVMIFAAALMVMFWYYTHLYLQRFTQVRHKAPGMLVLGGVGAVFLVLYADYLGTEGDVYRLMRRYGVIFYFTFTVLAQMLLLRALRHHLRSPQNSLPQFPLWIRLIYLNLFGILIIGLLSLGSSLALENPEKDRWENTLEWWFAMGMTLNFGFMGGYWRQVGFRL